MVYLLGKTGVDDFDQWRSNFDENDSYRVDNGQRGYQIYQSSNDPNEVVVLFEWDDEENARALFDSEEMGKRLADAGVKEKPELTALNRVG